LIVADDFESGTLYGGHGWLEKWKYSGNVTLIQSVAHAHSGSYYLQIEAGSYAYRNVSFKPNSRLQFWALATGPACDLYGISFVTQSGEYKLWAAFPTDGVYHFYTINLTQIPTNISYPEPKCSGALIFFNRSTGTLDIDDIEFWT
jgi:hypothetical protein